MEMFHLRYFVAVAEHLSFTRAARQLHMATSPLSQRIRDLERELGHSLFDRDSHSVQLTRAGYALLPLARESLTKFDELPWQLNDTLRTRRRTQHIGLPPSLNTDLRTKVRQLERQPLGGYSIKRWPGGTEELTRAVQRRELAMALVHLPVHRQGVSVAELLREPLGAVLPAAEFGSRDSVSLHELVDHAYVTPAPTLLSSYFEELEVRLSSAGIHKRIALSSGDYTSSGEIVANGGAFAISMMNQSSGVARYGDESLVVLPFDDFSAALPSGLIWRTDRADEGGDLRSLVREALEFFREQA